MFFRKHQTKFLNTFLHNLLKLYQVIKPHKSNIFLRNLFICNRSFVVTEGLKKIQEIPAGPGSKLRQYIDEINSIYPPEIVQYYSPDYAK